MDRKFAFCESHWAGPQAVEYIRVLPPSGLALGGGVNCLALCGREIKGWDLEAAVTPASIGHPSTCQACAAAFDTY